MLQNLYPYSLDTALRADHAIVIRAVSHDNSIAPEMRYLLLIEEKARCSLKDTTE